MNALNIQTYYGCDKCRNADERGQNCKEHMLLPVLLIMHNKVKCPWHQELTSEQVQERYNTLKDETNR